MVLALIVSILAPGIMALIQARLARAKQQEQWRREDQVAKFAAEANARAESSRREIIEEQKKAAAAAEKAATISARQTEHLVKVTDAVHTLVNGNLTSAIRTTLEAERQKLYWLRVVSKGRGSEAANAKSLIPGAVKRVEELRTQLRAREDAEELAATRADHDVLRTLDVAVTETLSTPAAAVGGQTFPAAGVPGASDE